MKEKIRVILKRGNEFVIECEKMTATHSIITGELEKLDWEGCTKNRPLYLDMSQVSAVLHEDLKNG